MVGKTLREKINVWRENRENCVSLTPNVWELAALTLDQCLLVISEYLLAQ